MGQWHLAIVLLTLVSAATFLSNLRADEPVEIMAGEILIKYKEGTSEDQKRTLEKKFNLTQFGLDPTIQLYFYKAPEDDITSKVDEIIKENIVKYAQANYIGKRNAVPNDPFYSQQWYLPHIGMPQVWNEFTGINFIRVAVIDSGINYSLGDIGSISDTGWDWNYVNGNSNPLDDNGHGTLIAGIISANANNGVGVAGISPKVKIVTLKVSILFENLEVFNALNRAKEAGCKIVNLSYGKLTKEPAVEDKIQWLNEQGILVVCSAGNGNADRIGDNCDVLPQYPSNYSSPNIIAVAATTPSSSLATFSNYGASSVDIAAPGTDIVSTLGVGDGERVYNQGYREGIRDYSFDLFGENWTRVNITTSGLNGFVWSLFDGAWITDYLSSTYEYASGSNFYLESPLIDCRNYTEIKIHTTISGALGFGDYLGTYSGLSNWNEKQFAGLLQYGLVNNTYVYNLPLLKDTIGRVWYWLTSDNDMFYDNGYLEINNVRISGIPIYGSDSGTSFSAPIVAGVAAMIMSQNPNLTHLQVKDIILQTARKVPALNGKVVSGGIVDAAAALREAKARMVAPPVINSSTTANGTVGSSFSYRITASGSPTSFSASGLPAGLSLNTSTGVISGTPTAVGTTSVSISATNAGGTRSATLTITVVRVVAPVITSTNRASGTVGSAFSFTIRATNTPTGFNAAGLPVGLSINRTSGVISGIPTTAGTNNVSLSASNSAGIGTQSFIITTAKGTPSVTWTSLAAITFGTGLSTNQLRATSPLAGTFTYSPPLGTILNAGTHSLVVTFRATASNNYISPITRTNNLIVAKANPTITRAPTASSITFGQAITNSRLTNGLANMAGTFSWANPTSIPSAGVSLNAVRFTPGNTTNYNIIATNISLTVAKAPQNLTFTLPATNTFTSNGLIPLNGKSSSGLALTYISGNTNLLVISGTNAVMKRRGTNTITAVQAGNSNYLAAPSVARTIVTQ